MHSKLCPEHCLEEAKADVELCCRALPLNSRCRYQTRESQKPELPPLRGLRFLRLNVRPASMCAHTVSHSVSRAASPCPALPCRASACVSVCSRPMSCVPASRMNPRFRPTRLSGQTHVCELGCPASKRVASERAKRKLRLVALTKLVCPLLPGRSCGRQR